MIGLDSRLIAEVTYYTAAIPAASKSSNMILSIETDCANPSDWKYILHIYQKN
jgi:hypothetical protein